MKHVFDLFVGALGGATLALGAITFVFAPHTTAGTHWHSKGCPGQGSNVYHASYIDEFPAGCKEFILVSNATDKPIGSFFEDEIRRAK